MPHGNAARVPYCRQPEFVTANDRSGYRSAANPSTLTRLLWRIRDRGFAMGHVTRIEMLTDHFTARYGQRHADVWGDAVAHAGGHSRFGGSHTRQRSPRIGSCGAFKCRALRRGIRRATPRTPGALRAPSGEAFPRAPLLPQRFKHVCRRSFELRRSAPNGHRKVAATV